MKLLQGKLGRGKEEEDTELLKNRKPTDEQTLSATSKLTLEKRPETREWEGEARGQGQQVYL